MIAVVVAVVVVGRSSSESDRPVADQECEVGEVNSLYGVGVGKALLSGERI
jgi:hypothetical protein